MKKIISLLLAAVISMASASIVSASEASPTIKVDGREIIFRDDQAPVIMEDRLYVPVRRVIETMGASVEWNGTKKTVTIDSADNIKRIVLTINSPEISIFTFTSVFHADEEKITNDVAPVVMNDRTMLPIRVIAEALGATVQWTQETLSTNIITRQAKNTATVAGAEGTDAEDFDYADVFKNDVPKLYITCDDKDIKEGDIVTLKLHLDGIEKFAEDARLSSTTVSIRYDKDAFTYGTYQCHANGEDLPTTIGSSNGDFYENCAKMVSIKLPQDAYLPGEDKVIMHITFRAKKDGGAAFAISDAVTEIGYDTQLLLITGEDTINSIEDTEDLYIDTTPIEVR